MDEVTNSQSRLQKFQFKNRLRSMRRYLKRSFLLPGIVAGVFVVIIVVAAVGILGSPASSSADSNEKVQLAKARATQTINKELQFPLKDSAGKEVSKIRYIIESAEIRDELIVKGKKARAVQDRTFLVIKIKILNTYKLGIQVNARDYIRLTTNGGKDKFAADIHSDPVEIQPDSTKQSRLAFPVNEGDKNLVLIIGELNGPKQEFKLNLKY